MKCSLRLLTIKEIEPFATQECDPEKIVFHMEWYMEHCEFIDPLILEVGGPRCERKNVEALLIDGNHRFRAAQALGLESVLVKTV